MQKNHGFPTTYVEYVYILVSKEKINAHTELFEYVFIHILILNLYTTY